MNESKNLACRVRPILEAIITEARNQHDDILTEQSWNPDYTLEVSLRVREIRALAQLLKAGGREPATPESTGVKALASASGSVAAGYWNPYPQDKPEQEGWYLVWHDGGHPESGYKPGAAMAWYAPRGDYWESDSSYAAIDDGCNVTHWAFVKPPNDQAQTQQGQARPINEAKDI